MLKPYIWCVVDGLRHRVMTQTEWERGYPDYSGVIGENSPLPWPVGTKTALYYDPQHGTCLSPVVIED